MTYEDKQHRPNQDPHYGQNNDQQYDPHNGQIVGEDAFGQVIRVDRYGNHYTLNDRGHSFPASAPSPVVAQGIRWPRLPIPLPIVPSIPTINDMDADRIQQYIQNGISPLDGQPISSPDAKKLFKQLNAEQIRKLKNSKDNDVVKFAVDPRLNNRGCTIVDLNIGNGGATKNMMVDAITGAERPTLVFTPQGGIAMFDGVYRSNLARHKDREDAVYEVEAIQGSTPQNKAFMKAKEAEWNRQAKIANACGMKMRIAVPDADLVRWGNQNLSLPNPKTDPYGVTPGPKLEEAIFGGTYGEVRDYTVSDHGEVHHMPSDDANKGYLNRRQGPAIWMYRNHHKATRSNGSSNDAKQYRLDQKRLIQQGNGSAAQLNDIKEILGNHPGVYNIPIKQMLKKTKGTY
jgi:hypothetical protein